MSKSGNNRTTLAKIPVGGIAQILTGNYAGQNVHVQDIRYGQMVVVTTQGGRAVTMGANKRAKQVIRVAKFD